MNNLIRELNHSMNLSPEQIQQTLEQRAPQQALNVSTWIQDDSSMPTALRHCVVMWIMEIWAKERDACSAKQLLDVDNKFSRILRDYSLTDLIAFKKELAQTNFQPPV
ncbi:MAG: hypothetical protein OEZ68_03055 [Gammaproteobacteria bacterium]|nr:hypothetical protein [Gammaproteobacteria bacterium]MDH5799761.1 hypothetical protein [Gammaproteobacteria bacterium]